MKIIISSLWMLVIVFFASCSLNQAYVQFENPIAGPEHPECKNQELVAFGGTSYCFE